MNISTSNSKVGSCWPLCAVVLVPDSCKSKHSKTCFEKNCFSAWVSTLNMGLINKVDMVCLSPVGYGV